jgi:hypothetical protein
MYMPYFSAVCIKTVIRPATVKQKVDFYVKLQKCIYDGLKSMLGIRKLIRYDTDLFGQIQILERAVEVCGLIFHTRSQIRI